MLLRHSFRGQLIVHEDCSYVLRCENGGRRFTGALARVGEKLYVIRSSDGTVAYVGVTKRPMATRLRNGRPTDQGQHGYHGYAWMRDPGEYWLDVWLLERCEGGDSLPHLESIEAEVVFLVRQRGDWPSHQTEIHFTRPGAVHRALARQVMLVLHPARRNAVFTSTTRWTN